MVNYFEVLNVSERAELEVIHSAYRALAKKYHPDTTNLPKEVAAEKMAQINEAYRILSNPEERKRYLCEYQQMPKPEQPMQEKSSANAEETESVVTDEEMRQAVVSTGVIMLIILLPFICCAIYFLPDLFRHTWNNIIEFVNEFFGTF